MVMQAIGVHDKVNIDSMWFLDYKGAIPNAIMRATELGTDILQRENIRDGAAIKPHSAVVLNMGFMIGCEGSAVAMNSHVVVALRYTGDKVGVAE